MAVHLSKTQLQVKVNLLETAAIMANGGLEKDVRAKFGDAPGQKLYYLYMLDKRFPNVKLIERFTLDSADPKFLKFSEIRGSNLPRLWLRSNPQQLEEVNRKEQTCGREAIRPLTEEQFEEFLTPPITKERENCIKMMNRVNIQAMSNCPIGIVREAFQAVLVNDVKGLQKYLAKADVIDTVVEALAK